jgi:hypothetical protein
MSLIHILKKFILKPASIFFMLYGVYALLTLQWTHFVITLILVFIIGVICQAIDRRYSLGEVSQSEENGTDKWDYILDGMDYNILRNDLIDFVKIAENEKIKNGEHYLEKESLDTIYEFIAIPTRIAAAKILETTPSLEQYFLSSKRYLPRNIK